MTTTTTTSLGGDDGGNRLLSGRLLKTLSISSPPISVTNSSSPPAHLMSSLKITTTNLLPNKPMMIDELPYEPGHSGSLLLTSAKPLIKSSFAARENSPGMTGPVTPPPNGNFTSGQSEGPAKRPTKLFETSELAPNSRFSEFYNQFPLKPSHGDDVLLEGSKLNMIQRELNPYPSRKSMHISVIPSSSSSYCSSSSSLSTLSSLSTISTPPLSPSETLSSQGKWIWFYVAGLLNLMECVDLKMCFILTLS